MAPGEDRTKWMRGLAEALRGTCLGNDLSGVHVNFCLPEELQVLEEAGFQARFGIQYHWHNHDYASFDDYLAKFRSKRRNQIRRERRELERTGVTIEKWTGEDIPDDLFAPMYRFYLATIQSRYWGRQYLNEALFDRMRSHFRKRLVFIVARQEGEPIAGTFNVTKGDALYGRYWGTTARIRYLHFNVCYYAAVEYCIENGIKRFEPGAGGEYKQLRGFDAQPTLSAHFLRDPRLAAAIERFLAAERDNVEEAIDWYRERSALKLPKG
jgi:predicted N-acyltransferase